MAGRKNTPTSLKILRGNPGKRALNKYEPQPTRGKPTRPVWLQGVGIDAWNELSALLDDMRVLTLADGPALALLCATYQDYRDAREVIARKGMTYECATQHDSIWRTRPEVAIMSDAAKRLRSLMTEFGLTPAARSRVHAEPEAPADPLEQLLRGPRRGA